MQTNFSKSPKQLTYKPLYHPTVHLRVFSWRTTHPVALKSIAKAPNQKVTRRPKCFFFFFFFHDGFRTKQQHFSLSSAPAHRIFPGLKSHGAIRTAYWRTMASFMTPFFSSRVRMRTDHLATKCIITQDCRIRNTVSVRGVFEESLCDSSANTA